MVFIGYARHAAAAGTVPLSQRPTFQVRGTWATLSPLADVFSLLVMNCGFISADGTGLTDRKWSVQQAWRLCAEMVSIRWTPDPRRAFSLLSRYSFRGNTCL